MTELLWASLFLLILLGGSAAGAWLQPRLREHHRSRESIEAVRMVVAMVVTFAALVLGLLVTSVKADFDDHTDLYRQYGISLIELDQRLREYGPQVETLRQQVRAYTASVFVLTWPGEPAPPGERATDLRPVAPGSDEVAALTRIMLALDDAMQHLVPADAFHARLAGILQDDIRQLERQRWTLVERSQSRLSPIFVGVLLSWLLVVFFVFGIVSPRNALTGWVIGLSALAVASSLYLTLDLDTSVGGFITVSSQPFRDALWHMDQPVRAASPEPAP